MLLLVQVPKLLELVGLGYTSWFVYRYLLFKVWHLAVMLSIMLPAFVRLSSYDFSAISSQEMAY